MGLSDYFNSIPSQILLLDHFSLINKAIYLVLHEEKQREITLNTTIPNLESIVTLTTKPAKTGYFASKQISFHKDKPVCSHGRYKGHASKK